MILVRRMMRRRRRGSLRIIKFLINQLTLINKISDVTNTQVQNKLPLPTKHMSQLKSIDTLKKPIRRN